ncbi:MAG: class I SAM-dependent methyltransferase [Caldilineaceae bacterium]|nr:class I SAM-dependent methyltransferase [Caldilineaceae bacterium]
MRSWDNRRASKARLLLRPAISAAMGGRWADVGCGDGVFTRLLLEWLAPGSTVVAIDRDGEALRRLQEQLPPGQQGQVQTVQADFTETRAIAHLAPFDGLLFANALHFVRDPLPVLRRWVPLLKEGGTVIIIEYNAARGNWAVPHPFRDATCLQLMHDAGLDEAQIVNREPSSFMGEIYTATSVNKRSSMKSVS